MASAVRWRCEQRLQREGGVSAVVREELAICDEVDEPPRRMVKEVGTDETGEVEEGPAASER